MKISYLSLSQLFFVGSCKKKPCSTPKSPKKCQPFIHLIFLSVFGFFFHVATPISPSCQVPASKLPRRPSSSTPPATAPSWPRCPRPAAPQCSARRCWAATATAGSPAAEASPSSRGSTERRAGSWGWTGWADICCECCECCEIICEPNPWCKVPSRLTPSVCRATGEPRWVYSACSCHFWLKMVSCDSGFTAALQSKVAARLSSSRPCDKGWQKVISGPVRWHWRDPKPFGSQLGAVLGTLSWKNRNGRGYYSSPPSWLGKYECSTEHFWKQSRNVYSPKAGAIDLSRLELVACQGWAAPEQEETWRWRKNHDDCRRGAVVEDRDGSAVRPWMEGPVGCGRGCLGRDRRRGRGGRRRRRPPTGQGEGGVRAAQGAEPP